MMRTCVCVCVRMLKVHIDHIQNKCGTDVGQMWDECEIYMERMWEKFDTNLLLRYIGTQSSKVSGSILYSPLKLQKTNLSTGSLKKKNLSTGSLTNLSTGSLCVCVCLCLCVCA